jgi:NAD(P)H-hydrate epimerase
MAGRLASLPRSWPPSYPLHRPLLTAEARALDVAAERCGLTALLLMEHAGTGLAAVARLLAPARAGAVAVVCGPGNNGGDGYACARRLASWGRAVRVVRVGPLPRSPAARFEARLWSREAPIADASRDLAPLRRALAGCALVVDALFGVGLDRPLGPAFVAAIESLNATVAPRLSVDVPSGLDADTGRPLPVCVHADVTATMAAPKRGIARGRPGARWAGRVVELDLGLPRALHARYLR